MEELVIRLAELQTELDEELIKADFASANIDDRIVKAKERLSILEKERGINRQPYTEAAEELNLKIWDVKAHILSEWDGKKNTLKFSDRVLNFRTTKSLEIRDDAAMLEDLCIRMQSYAEVMKYLKGFNLTEVKKYMSVHAPPPDVAELIEKTTVKLDVV